MVRVDGKIRQSFDTGCRCTSGSEVVRAGRNSPDLTSYLGHTVVY